MLDNDFRNPDLERYVERFHDVEPRVGVIGDADTVEEAREYVRTAHDLQARYPNAEIVIAPKCREAINAIPDDIILGYARGSSDRLAHEFSEPVDWRGRRVHPLISTASTSTRSTMPRFAGTRWRSSSGHSLNCRRRTFSQSHRESHNE